MIKKITDLFKKTPAPLERLEPGIGQDKRIQERLASDEPWVEVVGETDDPERGIKLELNWNQAFIAYLKQHGFSGDDENVIVQKWLMSINTQVALDLEDKAIDDRGDGTDYV